MNGPIVTRGRSVAGAAGTGVLSAAIGLVVLALGLRFAGYPPGPAMAALWNGAFGSWYIFTSATLVRSVPLIIIGLGITVAFRAGAFNIGAEGQFYAGAIAATWVGVHAAGWHPAAAIGVSWAAAIGAGALWVLVPVWLRQRYGVLEVISTLLLNFVADALVSWMVQGPLQEPTHIYPQSAAVAASARLPMIPGTRLHVGFLLAVGLTLVLMFALGHTRWGFRLRAVGAGPQAAEVSGRISAAWVIGWALLWSGALAGLAGAVEVGGVSYALYQNLSPGYGFTAIAVALLARLRPGGVIVTGILFGALEAGAGAMQRDAGVPAVTVYVVEAIIILLVLISDAAARRRLTLVQAG